MLTAYIQNCSLFQCSRLKWRVLKHWHCICKSDSDLLQRDLTTLEDWENKWQMNFNAKKCIVIRITPKNKQVRQTSYKLHGHTLDNVESSKYLGVTIDNNLSWDRHTDNIVCKGNKTLGFIRRNLIKTALNL